MRVLSIASRVAAAFALLAVANLLAGCTYYKSGPPDIHYSEFKAKPPRENTVTICSAYGCQTTAQFTFSVVDLAQIVAVMRRIRRGRYGSPHQERRAVAHAIAWMERRTKHINGIWSDRKSIDLAGSGDPTQMDCVDEATNTTSYLLVLQRHGLLRHHKVIRPFAKGALILGKWPHYGAMLRAKRTRQIWVVDSSFYNTGSRPIVMKLERWYN